MKYLLPFAICCAGLATLFIAASPARSQPSKLSCPPRSSSKWIDANKLPPFIRKYFRPVNGKVMILNATPCVDSNQLQKDLEDLRKNPDPPGLGPGRVCSNGRCKIVDPVKPQTPELLPVPDQAAEAQTKRPKPRSGNPYQQTESKHFPWRAIVEVESTFVDSDPTQTGRLTRKSRSGWCYKQWGGLPEMECDPAPRPDITYSRYCTSIC